MSSPGALGTSSTPSCSRCHRPQFRCGSSTVAEEAGRQTVANHEAVEADVTNPPPDLAGLCACSRSSRRGRGRRCRSWSRRRLRRRGRINACLSAWQTNRPGCVEPRSPHVDQDSAEKRAALGAARDSSSKKHPADRGLSLDPAKPIAIWARRWSSMTTYLCSRIQSTPLERPGRAPDMSPGWSTPCRDAQGAAGRFRQACS